MRRMLVQDCFADRLALARSPVMERGSGPVQRRGGFGWNSGQGRSIHLVSECAGYRHADRPDNRRQTAYRARVSPRQASHKPTSTIGIESNCPIVAPN
jgi:hypothetical protein